MSWGYNDWPIGHYIFQESWFMSASIGKLTDGLKACSATQLVACTPICPRASLPYVLHLLVTPGQVLLDIQQFVSKVL